MKRTLAVLLVVFAIGGTSVAAAAFGGGGGAGRFAATLEARTVTDGTITSCRGLGPGGQKIEARYEGTITVDGEEFGIHFVLEALFDRSTGVGTAEGRWTLLDPSDREIVGRGELLAAVTGDPPSEVNPPDPDLELHGLLIGMVDAPDPDLPAQRLLGNFTASLGEGATFPHLKGTVGDPSVGDPTGLESNPAVLVPAVKC
jgi:hypothetical protein